MDRKIFVKLNLILKENAHLVKFQEAMRLLSDYCTRALAFSVNIFGTVPKTLKKSPITEI
jgi:hypothetical protein